MPELREILKEKEEKIEELENTILEKYGEIDDLEDDIERKDEYINGLEEERDEAESMSLKSILSNPGSMSVVDQMKLDLIKDNWNKLKLEDLEELVR